MNKKSKTTLILLGTLVIGIVLGVLISALFVRRGIERVGSFLTEDGFKDHVIALVDPDPDQLEQIEQIFDKRQGELSEAMDQHFSEMKSIRDGYMEDLAEVLSEEQNQKLQQRLENMRGRMGRFRKHMGPPRGRHGQGGMRGGPMGLLRGALKQGVIEAVEANEEQQAQITKLFEDFQEKMFAHRPPGRMEAHGQMDSLMIEVEEYLDEDQIKKLREFWRERRNF